jgi:hypothetical protein
LAALIGGPAACSSGSSSSQGGGQSWCDTGEDPQVASDVACTLAFDGDQSCGGTGRVCMPVFDDACFQSCGGYGHACVLPPDYIAAYQQALGMGVAPDAGARKCPIYTASVIIKCQLRCGG